VAPNAEVIKAAILEREKFVLFSTHQTSEERKLKSRSSSRFSSQHKHESFSKMKSSRLEEEGRLN
jgi:hypothetical protein